MTITKANLQQMMNAVQNLEEALPQVTHVETQADDALAAVRASWRSPEAAPAFYHHLQTWQADHQSLTSTLTQLSSVLAKVHKDLLTKEQAFTS